MTGSMPEVIKMTEGRYETDWHMFAAVVMNNEDVLMIGLVFQGGRPAPYTTMTDSGGESKH